MAEETVILHFEVDQAKAERQLEKIEGILLDNKKAQQELTKAYKEGNITQEEYVKENIRLQQNIRKEQEQKKALIRTLDTESNSRNAIKQRVSQLAKEYDNLNLKTAQGAKRADELEKELAQLNAQLTKGDKAAGLFKNQIGNYPQQFTEAAKGINVAGVSVGDLTGKIASFANPATAAIGIVTALGAAYASSSKGSRDLAFASAQLSSVLANVSEDLANLVNGGRGGDRGLVSSLTDSYLSLIQYVPAIKALDAVTGDAFSTYIEGLRKTGEAAAEAVEQLKELEISRAFAAGDAKTDERRAELARRIRDDEKEGLDARIAASKIIDDLLTRSGERTKIVIEAQIAAIKESTVGYENNRQAQLQVAQLTAEIADKEEEITGKLTENVTARKQLLELKKQEQELFEFEVREANAPDISLGNQTGTAARTATDPVIQASKLRQEQYVSELKTVTESEQSKRRAFEQTAEYKQMVDQVSFDTYMSLLGETTNLVRTVSGEQSDIYKIAASAQTIIATYSSATKSYDSLASIPYVGPALGAAAAAAAIASGLANLATINGVQFAEGGWTGPGAKYDVAGVVHADEYVVPKHVNNSPAAQPHLAALERMRSGYADGGFVVNQSTASSQQALIMANAMRNLPTPVVSVKEITRKQDRVRVRENVSTLNR